MKKIVRLIAVMLSVLIVAALATGCLGMSSRRNVGTPNNIDTAANSNNAITEEQAKEIALERAGLTADEVVFDRVEFDRDDGVDRYEVEFRKDRTEYDTDIAMDGTILSWDVDMYD